MSAPDRPPLTVPEVRRLLRAREVPPARQQHLLAWSRFRRQHHAHAGRAPAARPAHTLAGRSPTTAASPAEQRPPALRVAGTALRTEATWAQIAPLLPTLQVAPKRTCSDHRWVLDGILAVMRSGRRWREGPAGDAPWPIRYQRYSLGRRRGIWDAIVRILHPDVDTLVVP